MDYLYKSHPYSGLNSTISPPYSNVNIVDSCLVICLCCHLLCHKRVYLYNSCEPDCFLLKVKRMTMFYPSFVNIIRLSPLIIKPNYFCILFQFCQIMRCKKKKKKLPPRWACRTPRSQNVGLRFRGVCLLPPRSLGNQDPLHSYFIVLSAGQNVCFVCV